MKRQRAIISPSQNNSTMIHATLHPEKCAPVTWDVVFFGGLMIVSGMMDIYIIVANPEYRLPMFGTRPEGALGWFVKLTAPPIHFLAGAGAILGKRWAYPLMIGYSIYGLTNAVVNRLLLPPPHRIRTIFIVATLLLIGYLYARRDQFKN